jgi:hypothetical protein
MPKWYHRSCHDVTRDKSERQGRQGSALAPDLVDVIPSPSMSNRQYSNLCSYQIKTFQA